MNDAHGLTAENLLRTLPDVLKNDESMAALAAAIAQVLSARPSEIRNLMIYPRIEELPEDLLDTSPTISKWTGGMATTRYLKSVKP